MTRREQLLLLGVGLAICAGAGALYFHGSSSVEKDLPSQPADKAPVAPAESPTPAEPTRTIPIEPQPMLHLEEPPVPDPLPLAPPKPLLVVSVGGAVNEPGVYKLPDDARVQDLIDKAQGLREDADLSDVNLAARVMDGTTLTVPARRTAVRDGKTLLLRNGESAAAMNPPQYTISGWRVEATAPAESPRSAAAPPRKEPQATADAAPPGLIDLNTASQEMLDTLPGIGPKTAEKIIAYRSRSPFQTVDDLKNVAGIGDKKLEAIRSQVTVRGASSEPSQPHGPSGRKQD